MDRRAEARGCRRKHAGGVEFGDGVRRPRTATWPQLAAKGWEIVHQRPADRDELVAACRFLSESIAEARATGQTGDLELAALTSLCQQLLISNEFLYVD